VYLSLYRSLSLSLSEIQTESQTAIQFD
jgi:hypothetical protein